ncbi:MAG: HlyD family efflux transporter periplasmic adaptor subunit, partial [Saprospiraceae bacterium]|nr:HlyD family efflux transporter periplasmic adaptor subunit [Saprospiraceae bacterium]
MRKTILFILGLIIIGGAVFISKKIIENKQIPAPREKKIITSVFTQPVTNASIPVTVSTNGLLTAKYRLELYSEVQGVFNESATDFKPGAYYSENSILLKINSDEHQATLRAQKSSLFNQIVLLLPDLRLDYPDAFPAWEAYVNDFNVEKPIKALPEPKSDREKLFITGRNIYTPYYSVKNLEERMSKYTIRAPFGGVLTQALVTKGTLIRSGQKLGEFINPNVYELQVPVNTAYSDLVKVGQQVDLHNIEKTKTWQGKIIRINSIVDQATQSIQVYILVSGKDLKEGMYLEADLQAREVEDAFEVDRKLLVEENQLFYVIDTTLLLTTIEPIYFKDRSVVVKGLEDGMRILARPVPGATAGMTVQVLEDIAETN